MSEIYGKMNASGNVVLVNPNGIILAKGSEINAGGFAAYAAAGTKLTDPANRLSEGNIIADGTINVGVGTAKGYG
jgi:large exoprotein involved in heme utilization and adhesion